MTTPHLLIVAIIVAFVIAFVITMFVLNASAKKIIDTNTKLVENQNMLVEQNKRQGQEIEKRMEELELQGSKLELQKSELDEQKGMIEKLQKQQEELAEQLKHAIPDEVMQLKRQIQGHQEHIEQTADMTDAQLMAWVDLQMDETKLYTDTNLTLKTMARALGLTQKRLAGLYAQFLPVSDGSGVRANYPHEYHNISSCSYNSWKIQSARAGKHRPLQIFFVPDQPPQTKP